MDINNCVYLLSSCSFLRPNNLQLTTPWHCNETEEGRGTQGERRDASPTTLIFANRRRDRAAGMEDEEEAWRLAESVAVTATTAVRASSLGETTRRRRGRGADITKAADDDRTDEDEGAMSPNELEELHVAMVNELCAPEVLRQNAKTMTRAMDAVRARTQRIEQNESGREDLELGILQLDLDRLKYALSTLVRTRAWKLQRHAFHYLERRTAYAETLTREEWDYLESYAALKRRYLHDTVLSRLSQDFDSLHVQDDANVVRRPRSRAFVVCRVDADLGEIEMVRGAKTDVAPGDVYTAQFDMVKPYVESGRARLL